MGIAAQLQDIDRGFEIVASFPELKGKPIVIGESDPDGCAACPATLYPAERLSQRHALRQLHRGRLRPQVLTWPRSTGSTSKAR